MQIKCMMDGLYKMHDDELGVSGSNVLAHLSIMLLPHEAQLKAYISRDHYLP